MKYAKGTQGNWFATAKTGEYLPCLKTRYIGRGGMYHEPKAYDTTHGKGREYLEAIQNGRVLMARYETRPA